MRFILDDGLPPPHANLRVVAVLTISLRLIAVKRGSLLPPGITTRSRSRPSF